jgi:hypothetical protein
MIKVSIEVRSKTARFAVAVQAKSIKRALSIVEARYPGSGARVKFPIDPEGFFVGYSAGVGRGGKSPRPHRNGQVATNESRRLEELIMQTATPDRKKITEIPRERSNKGPATD